MTPGCERDHHIVFLRHGLADGEIVVTVRSGVVTVRSGLVTVRSGVVINEYPRASS